MAFLQTQGFKSVLARMEKQFGLDNVPVANVTPLSPSSPRRRGSKQASAEDSRLRGMTLSGYELIQDEKALQRWIDRRHRNGYMPSTLKPPPLAPCQKQKLVGISMSTAETRQLLYALQHRNPEGYSEDFDFSMKEKRLRSN